MYSRKYKITLTIDVPISDKYGMDEDSIADFVKAYLKVHNPEIFEISKQPLEEIHDDWQGGPLSPEDDPEDITKFQNAVGYIAPDGKFYGGEDGYDPLMHVLYAKEVWEAYKDKISENTIRTYGHSSSGLDYDLERWGFIKVRSMEIRYYVPCRGTAPVIPWTTAQCNTVMRYIKMLEKTRNCSVSFVSQCGHGTYVSSKDFAKMNDADIINCFRD